MYDKKIALHDMAKMLGLFEKHNEQRSRFSNMTEEELDRKIAEMERLLGRRKANKESIS